MGAGGSVTEQLSNEELKRVITSWEDVMRDPENNGVVIFKKFLKKHNYYKYFPKFSNVAIEQLPYNMSFRRHAFSILQALNKVAMQIDDPLKLKMELHALGKMHKGKNITEQQFMELKIVVLEILQNTFKTPIETLNAWDKSFNIVFPYIFDGLKDTS